jgi:hypothetical protein
VVAQVIHQDSYDFFITAKKTAGVNEQKSVSKTAARSPLGANPVGLLPKQQAHAASEPEPNPDDEQGHCGNISSIL